ncbi:MAG: hypothetical protein JO306_05680 [Gemmatimonadetes bacterium]|nr:hypothetical protein [Gemmatimonadota bacterium]
MQNRKINLLAALVIGAGALTLSAPAPAHAKVFDGCSDAQAIIDRAAANCAAEGGSFTFGGWCSSTEYSVWSQCKSELIPG